MNLNTRILSSLICIFIVSCQPPSTERESTEKTTTPATEDTQISFYTSDSVQIYGDFFQKSQEAPTILLFHQGGSNARAEYGPIIPRLLEEGLNILAIDQRSGGQTYGSYNRTIAQLPLNDYGYCDAYADLEGALNYLKQQRFNGKKIAWGSSYSGSLVIQLASKHPDEIDAVLAFSPASGGPMQDCRPDEYFESLEVPLLLLRPLGETQIESVQQQLEMAQQAGHQTYVADPGAHGSSMLVQERAEGSVDAHWQVVRSFLRTIMNS